MGKLNKIFFFLFLFSIAFCSAQTTIYLKDVPAPKVFPIPIKAGGSYFIQAQSGPKEIKLLPPKKKSADFYSTIQTYTSDQGLAMDAISYGHKNGLCDRKGNLWFGTNGGGVSRYDGKSFVNYTTAHGLVNNIVQSIIEDKNGNLWFGTSGGLSRYDGKTFTNYTTAQGLPDDIIWSIIEDKAGNLWFGTHAGGVSRFDGKAFTNYTTAHGLSHNNVSCIMQDKTGALWFGSHRGGVSRYDGKSFVNYTVDQGLTSNIVLSVAEDKAGNIWFGTGGGGVSRYDGKSFTNFTTADGLAADIVVSIIQDKAGDLWFGTGRGGVSCYDGKAFKNLTTGQGLANNFVCGITEDKTGNLWFGTDGGGVSRYDGKAITNYTARGETVNTVWSINEDSKGNLWFGTGGGGVSCYDGNSFTDYTPSQGLAFDIVLCITEDKTGNIWFGTKDGISRYDGKSFTNFTTEQGLVDDDIKSILVDNTGNLWFGTNAGGVSRYDGKSFTNFNAVPGLANNVIRSINEDKAGNIWFGTEGGGVFRYDGESFTNYTTAQGLAHNAVWCATVDIAGNLWFGTEGGLSRYDGRTFITYTAEHGLSDNMITQVIADKQNNIVIGTNFGIGVWQGFTPIAGHSELKTIPAQNPLSNEELKNYSLTIETYNSAKGYAIKDVNAGQNAMFCDSKGIIWMGTGSDKTGLVRFDYKAINKNLKPLNIVLQNIKINKVNICFYDLSAKADSATIAQQEIMTYGKLLNEKERKELKNKYAGIKFDSINPFYPLPQNLILPYTHNHIGFEFMAIEPARPYLVKYQYMLVGMDSDWSPLSNKTNAEFNNLWEGTYTFTLRAQSPFGVWSDPVSYTFKVLPPWWRTWLMYLLYIVILVGTVIFIVWWNHRRLISQKNKLKTKIIRATNTIREEKEKIQKANELITLQRKETEEQKKLVEEKNKDILDSIHYAKRIQDAMLIKREYFEDYIPEYLLLFMPKDIVSGDFYWAHSKLKSGRQPVKENMYWYLAVADCTGHGVPGAVMSMLGLSFLHEIIKDTDFPSPAEILESLREKVIKELGQTGERENSKDGMDISLIRWDFTNNDFLWAGANNPIFLIRNGELEKIKGDKQPIGYFPEPKPFTNQSFKLEKGDCFYIFSDGYADQFGGPLGKKFKYKQLEDLLLQNWQLPMKEQRKILRDTFKSWKGDQDQVDDVCIVGIRVE